MDKEQLKIQRKRLLKIYQDHNIPEFRQFIIDQAPRDGRFAPYVDKADDVLSDLMHTMKSGLIYLGPQWQESRNHLREKKFWSKLPLKDYPQEVLSFVNDNEDFPRCMTCRFYTNPPANGGDKEYPCMSIGAIAGDICCPAYTPTPDQK